MDLSVGTGTLKLYNAVTRAKAEILAGYAPGHEFPSGSARRIELRSYFADWMARQLGASGTNQL